MTRLSFPALRRFDPILFDRDGRSRALVASETRDALHRQVLDPRVEEAARSGGTGVTGEMSMKATSPSTAIVASMRDIIL